MIEDTINKKVNEAASKAVPVLMDKLIDTIIYDAKVDGVQLNAIHGHVVADEGKWHIELDRGEMNDEHWAQFKHVYYPNGIKRM